MQDQTKDADKADVSIPTNELPINAQQEAPAGDAPAHPAGDPQPAPAPAAQPGPAPDPAPAGQPEPAPAAQPTAQPDLQPTAQPGPDPQDEELEAQLAYENLKRRRAKKRQRRIIAISAAVLVLLVGAVVFIMLQANGASEDEGENKLVTSMVYQGDFATTITANGATEPLSSTVVTPEVDGIIENLQVEEGKKVNEGDVLFTLKNEELDKEVRAATTELETAERAANTANAAVDEAYDAYNKAVEEYNNASEEEGAEFDEASLRASITSAEEAYRQALDAVEAARAKVSEEQSKADKRTVRAPVSGTIVSMNAKNGMGVGSATGATTSGSGSSDALMQISDLSQMKVTVEVNEVDISRIKENQEAKATFSALEGVELEAKVVRIASSSTGVSSDSGGTGGSGGVVTYAVGLIIPKPDPNLKPGMTATVTITTQSAPNSLIVPTSAVQEGEQGKYVTVVTNEEKQETKDVPVEVVMQNSSEAAIKGAVKDGDPVVIGGGASAVSDADLEAGADADDGIVENVG